MELTQREADVQVKMGPVAAQKILMDKPMELVMAEGSVTFCMSAHGCEPAAILDVSVVVEQVLS